MRIPNLPSWNRRLRIQGAADVVERRQGILLVTDLTIHQILELRHHPVDLAVDTTDEAAVGILRCVVFGQATSRQIAIPVIQLLFRLAPLLVPFGVVFPLVALGSLQAVDERLEINDVVGHGYLRCCSVLQPGNLSSAP